MKKSRTNKILLAGFLLLICGLLAAFVFDVNPLARAKPEDRSLDQLIADVEVELFSDSKRQVEVILKDLSGSDVNISEFRGKIVFLNFWATWCPSCVVEMPSMEKLHQKLKNKDFAMVSISIQDPPLAVKRFFLLNNLTFIALLDQSGKTVPGFGISAIPTTLILDKTGRIIGRATGPREWDSRESVAMFDQLINKSTAN
jgi:thiol-disulfide isomerase/thioredoxin